MTGRVPIYVISLVEAAQRRGFMRAQLSGAAMSDWRFIDAVAKSEIDQADLAERARPRPYASGELTISEQACLASHLKTLRAILDDGHQVAAILEDDATLAETFPEILAALAGTLEGEAPVVALLHWAALYYGMGGVRLAGAARLRRAYAAHGAQGYVVTRAGARRLLEIHDEVVINPDDWSYFLTKYGLDVRCVVPYCVSHGLVGRASQLVHRHGVALPRRGVARLEGWLGAKWRDKFIHRPLRFVRRQPRFF